MRHASVCIFALAACGATSVGRTSSSMCPAGAPVARPRFVEWRGACLAELAGEVALDGGALVARGAPAPTGVVATAPPVRLATPFTEAVVSWNAETPPGSWIEVRLAAGRGDRWTTDYVLGVWSSEAAHRHSVKGQSDADGAVETDTLVLLAPADRLRLSVRLVGGVGGSPRVHGLAVATSERGAPPPPLAPLAAARGVSLDVPPRSQMRYPDGGEGWCSPTSTSMVLAYWGRVLGRAVLIEGVPAAAAASLDPAYGGTGNWPFNTAHAAALAGGELRAVVARLERIEQLERLVVAGVPVVISASWEPGRLTGAPMAGSRGHLIVVRGFDAGGDVVVNDPAADSDAAVRRTYRRAELDAAWARSGRTTYLIHPVDRPLPTEGALGSW